MKIASSVVTSAGVFGVAVGLVLVALVALNPPAPAADEAMRRHIDSCPICSDPDNPRAACAELGRIARSLYPPRPRPGADLEPTRPADVLPVETAPPAPARGLRPAPANGPGL